MYELGAHCLCWQGAELFITKASAHSTTRCRSTCDGCLWQKHWAQFEAGWMFRKCSFCCSSKWLFPEETALACVCWLHQKVPIRNCIYLYIAQPVPNWSFLFSFLTAPSELCTTHGYTALSVNTVQQRTRELLQLPHQNTHECVQSVSSYCSSSVEVMWLFQAKGIISEEFSSSWFDGSE